jgi:hypothetical protein
VYSRARYLNSIHGQWTQPDPLGFADGLDRYAYVQDSPTGRTDPLGLFSLQCLGNCIEASDPVRYLGRRLAGDSEGMRTVMDAIGYFALLMGTPIPKTLAELLIGRAIRGVGRSIFTSIPSTLSTLFRLGRYGAAPIVRLLAYYAMFAVAAYGIVMFGVTVACLYVCVRDDCSE